MPSRKTTRAAKANAARMPSIPRELLDQIEKQGPMEPIRNSVCEGIP